MCGAGLSTIEGSCSPAEPSRPLGQQLTPAGGVGECSSGGGAAVEEGQRWGRDSSGGGAAVEEGQRWRRGSSGGGAAVEEGQQ